MAGNDDGAEKDSSQKNEPNEPGGEGTIGGTPVGIKGTVTLVLYLVAMAAATLHVLWTVWPDDDSECPPPAASASVTVAQASVTPDAGAPHRQADGGTSASVQKPDGGASAGGAANAGAAARASAPAAAKRRTCRHTVLFLVPVTMSSEIMLVLLVLASGILGSLVHTLRSLIWYVGNRFLYKSWALQYLLQPLVGGLLALVFYLLIRGGLFAWSSNTPEVNPFGFAAVAAVIGMFSPQAAVKLKQIADTLFTPPPGGRESLPQGNGNKDKGTLAIMDVTPPDGASGGGTSVHVTGTGFKKDVVVQFGGVDVTKVEFMSDTSLQVTTPKHDIGPVDVTVTVDKTSVTRKGAFRYT